MIERIKKIALTSTFRQTLITSSGTIVNGLLGMVFYILVARFLGPANFGIFSVSVAAIALVSSIANIGVDTGVVRFVGRHIINDRERAMRFLKMGLYIKVISALVVLVFGWIFVPFIAQSILIKSELVIPLRLSLIGVGTALLFSFVTASVQAIQKFWVWSGLNIFSNLLRLIATFCLLVWGILNVENVLIAYIIFPFLGFIAGLAFLPKFWEVKNEKLILKEFLTFNVWVAVFTCIVAISSRLDTFLSARLLTLYDVGIYSVAVSLTGVIPGIVYAIATVVAPKLASFRTKKEAFIYLKKVQIFVLGLALLGVAAGIPISYLLVPIFYGTQYASSVTPLVVLIIAQAIFLISIPAHTSIIYYFSYPKIFVYIGLVHLSILLFGGWFMISSFGYMGAAYIFLIGSISNFILPFVWSIKKFRQ